LAPYPSPGSISLRSISPPSPARGEGKRNLVLATQFFAPELCSPSHEEDSLPQRMIPKSLPLDLIRGCGCGFRTRSCATKQGSGAPKGALSNQCPHRRQVYAVCVNHLCAAARCTPLFPLPLAGEGRVRARARLSALTLAALATGSTRWLSSRTGFPAAFAQRVFCPLRLKDAAAVKHAPCGPVFVPVDRGPEAARVRIGKKIKKSARGDRASPSLLRHAVRKAMYPNLT
jgi:hypothetical protein